ncbi:heavy-metal-associated domain-containing protein [Streptomyces sp. NBC_00683]|uniref:heavy-metal-associated domain-containing protein n=1 Tax=Streptomyces sp. NBC_00683 TaxID=2903670 RepID=UPI002E34729F|nr:heavy-metal-associated domain-containing protein [Streptomyces sp. NBC_00683]
MSWFTSGGSRPAVHGTTTTAAAGRTATVYRVSGMTCGHCRTAITKSVGALDEVVSVDVDVAGGLVTVTAGGQPDDTAIAAAVDDAGYELTGRV